MYVILIDFTCTLSIFDQMQKILEREHFGDIRPIGITILLLFNHMQILNTEPNLTELR